MPRPDPSEQPPAPVAPRRDAPGVAADAVSAADTAPIASAIPDAPVATPSRIGRYQIVTLLGSGSYGSVFLGTHRFLRVPGAVKVLRRPLRPDLAADFLREARRLASLRGHPGIAEIRDFGFYRDPLTKHPVPYFVTDPVPGALSLTAYADANRLDQRQRLAVFARVCDAVHHAHDHGIIHLDLKPANILVCPPGPGAAPQPKVIDFGLARAAEPPAGPSGGHVAGTLAYMSPEQTIAGATLDGRSDVYSLGVILYQLLCAKMPYQIDHLVPLIALEIIRTRPPDLDSPPARTLPLALRSILDRALQKDPGQRTPSAAALGADIRAHLRGELPAPLRRHPLLRLWAEGRGMVARHPRLALAGAMLLSMALTDSIGVPLLYSWTGATAWFDRTFASAVVGDRLAAVVIVARTTGTDAALGLPPPGAKPDKSFRAILARAARSLAPDAPRAIAFDLTFSGESLYDAELADAARLLTGAGCPAIVGVASADIDPADGLPPSVILSKTIAGAVTRWGSVLLNASEHDHWLLPLARRTDAPDIVESLPLAAVTAAMHPTLVPVYDFDEPADTLNIRFCAPPSRPGAPRSFDGTTSAILRVSGVRTEPAVVTRLQRPGDDGSDTTAWLLLPLPDDAFYERSTIPLERILANDPAAHAACRGKVVLFADTRPGIDTHPHPSGPRHGSFAHALAAEMALSGAVLRRPSRSQELFILAVGAAGGLLLPLPVARRRRWWPRWASVVFVGAWITFIVGALAGGGLAAWSFHYLFNPLIIVIAMLAAAALASVVHAVKRTVPVPISPYQEPAL